MLEGRPLGIVRRELISTKAFCSTNASGFRTVKVFADARTAVDGKER
jgi:hypothetical protein